MGHYELYIYLLVCGDIGWVTGGVDGVGMGGCGNPTTVLPQLPLPFIDKIYTRLPKPLTLYLQKLQKKHGNTNISRHTHNKSRITY